MASQIDHGGERKPIPKPEPKGKKPPKYIKVKTDSKWATTRRNFLKGKEDHRGWYKCEGCGNYTDTPEVDHLETRGARPDLKHDFSNLQILCFQCHHRKHHQI